MRLSANISGSTHPKTIVCVHGLGQHKGVYNDLATRLSSSYKVISVDLRGHGDSGTEPPWRIETHVADLLGTIDALDVEQAVWIGHSFGGRLAATVGAIAAERVSHLVLLDPGLEVMPVSALAGAERDRLDWSFASIDGAANALLSSPLVSKCSKETVLAYAEEDLQKGMDGRLRFRFSPSAVVAAWGEVVLPPPKIAQVPTLLIRPIVSISGTEQIKRYRAALGSRLSIATVPNGHHVLWESFAETMGAIEDFLSRQNP